MKLYKDFTVRRISETLYIYASTIRRILKLYDSSDIAPKQYQHGPARMLGETEKECIVFTVLSNPGIYLDELQRKLHAENGTSASISTICRTLNTLGFTRKKLSYVALQQDEIARQTFFEEMSLFTVDLIIWLDEMGSDRRKERMKFGYHLHGITPVEYSLSIGGHILSVIALKILIFMKVMSMESVLSIL